MEREQTPKEPGAAPPPRGDRPEDPGKETTPPHQRPASDRPRPPARPHAAELLHGQWGNLPEKEQELLLNPSSDQLPVRYRRYIEEYFSKVRRPPR